MNRLNIMLAWKNCHKNYTVITRVFNKLLRPKNSKGTFERSLELSLSQTNVVNYDVMKLQYNFGRRDELPSVHQFTPSSGDFTLFFYLQAIKQGSHEYQFSESGIKTYFTISEADALVSRPLVDKAQMLVI